MTKRTLQVLIALALVTGTSFGAVERVVKFQNNLRVGYDDNIYNSADEVDSVYITDIINLSAKLNFSTRTDALLYWEPEFQYRFDAEPKFITYQTLYGRLNHALSQRVFLTISDRFRYQQKEGQAGPALDDYNQNYIENDLMGALDFALNDKSYIKLGGGYEFRVWDDADYGEWQNPGGGNDYDNIKGDLSYYRDLKPNKTTLMGGINGNSLSYDGERGGYDSVALLLGIDQNFTPTFNGFGRFGYSMNSVDSVGSSDDTSAPYLRVGLESQPSARTSLTTSLGYSMYRSENSLYNAQDQLNFGLGARHDITAKITLSGSFNYIYSYYDAKYSSFTNSDAKDNYLSLGLRGSYQVNRNNFVELGYLFRTRNVSGSGGTTLSDWDGNRIDMSWRLRL